MFVITGAAGRLGNVLVKRLRKKYPEVPIRSLILSGENTESLHDVDCEIVEADVTNYASLEKAFAGAKAVFHLAGFITLETEDPRLEKVNVEGTANVIKACQANNVSRLVHVASAHAISEPEQEILMDESRPFCEKTAMGAYGKSKARGAKLVQQAALDGQIDAVLVCPTGIIGPLDYGPSPQGNLIVDATTKMLQPFVDGYYDFVDVRDVADGIIGAYEKGSNANHYILSGERTGLLDIMKLSAKFVGRRNVLRIFIPRWLAKLTGIIAPIYSKLKNRSPLITSESVDIVFANSWLSNRKARQELGYAPRSVFESIKDSVSWFQQRGLAPQKKLH